MNIQTQKMQPMSVQRHVRLQPMGVQCDSSHFIIQHTICWMLLCCCVLCCVLAVLYRHFVLLVCYCVVVAPVSERAF